jgi:GalNAc-alpha-(1->4)-GalNAc-alpha-(1->3)-diNAcBac-PP-undecaprenol alpha-1,4-N-acetyl-D-galactosaminyltransferase
VQEVCVRLERNLQDTCEPAASSQRNSAVTIAESLRVTFVVAGLRCGGVERASVSLIEGLAGRGHRVSLVTFSAADTDFFRVPDGVVRTESAYRDASQALFTTPYSRLKRLQRAIAATAPDVVVAHAPQINVPTLLALRGRPVPVVVTEHGDVPIRPDALRPDLWKKWLWYRLRRPCYRWAFRVVSASEAIDRNFAWLPRQRRSVIHNPFQTVSGQPMPAQLPPGLASQRPWLVSMGRLSHAKGFDVLLAAFSRIAARFPEWQLLILGDGELRDELRRQASHSIPSDQVIFAGALPQPFALLQRAKVFVMASRYEGFPMAHGEALSCGLPVIATDCPSRPLARSEGTIAGGVRELVRDGVDGVLVPCEDPAALASAMAQLIEDPGRRERLAQQAAPGMNRYSSDRIVDAWEELLERAHRSSAAGAR